MIKVIIVDDDIEMLHGLANIIDWNKYDFEVVGLADNGTDALKLTKEHNPEIIISDITMPLMNGLDLIREVKKFRSDIKSIILTCHQDFNYAKEAIELEVDFYLVKYMLTEQELLKSLLKVKQKLDKELQQKEMLASINRELNVNKQVIKEKFIKDFLDHQHLKKEDIYNKAKVIGINLPESYFRAVGVFIDNFDMVINHCSIKENDLLSFSIQNILEDIFRNEKNSNVFSLSNREYLVIYSEYDSCEKIKQKLISNVTEIQKNIYAILHIKVSICIGKVYDNILKISSAISDIRILRESYFYKNCEAIVMEQVQYRNVDTDSLYEKFIGDFKKAIISLDYDSTYNCIIRIFSEIESSQYSPRDIRKFFKQLAAGIQSYANTKSVFFDMLDVEGDTLKYYKAVFEEKVAMLFKKLLVMKDTPYRKEIKKVLEYIDRNLEKNISCEMMAEYVNMNMSYFSRLFKNEVGISFSEYLLKVKIERATTLLTETALTAEEISKIVGFENVSYFYRIYKKVTGKTTREIRDVSKMAETPLKLSILSQK